jgi:hypothetical protein
LPGPSARLPQFLEFFHPIQVMTLFLQFLQRV